MREIKFRAWVPVGEWDEKGEYEMCYDLAFDEFEPINDLLKSVEFLMQFTGLLDKNGKEIYEGDKCNATYEGGDYGECHVYGYKVIFDEGRFGLAGKDGDYLCSLSYCDTLEIIGNVHENEGLVKE